FAPVNGNLQTNIVRQFGEGSYVRHQHRPPQPERPQQRAGTFPCGWIPQADTYVHGAHIPLKVLDRHVSQRPYTVLESERLYEAVDGKIRVLLPHQNHPDSGLDLRESLEGAQRFRDSLVRLQEAEDADEGRCLIQAEP